jgi:uncharacterized iron-regulated protein
MRLRVSDQRAVFALTALLFFIGCSASPRALSLASSPSSSVDQLAQKSNSGSIDSATLDSTLSALSSEIDILLIGETHDHPEHHQIQAQVIRSFKPKSVAFEMLNQSQQSALNHLPETSKNDWGGLLQWTQRGWPDFALYAPVFEAAVTLDAHLIAAHPDRSVLKPLMLGSALDDQLRADLSLDHPLPAQAQKSLEAEIIRAHCGHAPSSMISPMVEAQRLKDAWMARALIEAPKPVVLIVGRGHTRPDRGIPWAIKQILKRRGSSTTLRVKVLSLDIADPAQKERRGSTSIVTEDGGIVVSLMTAPHRTDDPCERFKEQLRRLKHKKRAPKASPKGSPSP